MIAYILHFTFTIPTGRGSEYLQILLNRYPIYIFLTCPIGQWTTSKVDLVSVQINTIEVYFQINFSVFECPKYG